MAAHDQPELRRARRAATRTERRQWRETPRRPWWQRLSVLSGVFAVGGLAVVLVAVGLGLGRPPTVPADDHQDQHVLLARRPAGLASNGFALGAPDAPVTVDVYEDFQCPACRDWGQSVVPPLAAGELARGEARLVFHDFAFIGPESVDAARAGYAAGRQGRFWDMWATIYANQGAENSGALSTGRLESMAALMGLDLERFVADMASPAAHDHVAAAMRSAGTAGIDSTPTVLVNGTRLEGASYERLADAIAAASGR